MKTPPEHERVRIAFKLIELRKAGHFHGVWLTGASILIRWTMREDPQLVGWSTCIQLCELFDLAEQPEHPNAVAAAAALVVLTGRPAARIPPTSERAERARKRQIYLTKAPAA